MLLDGVNKEMLFSQLMYSFHFVIHTYGLLLYMSELDDGVYDVEKAQLFNLSQSQVKMSQWASFFQEKLPQKISLNGLQSGKMDFTHLFCNYHRSRLMLDLR